MGIQLTPQAAEQLREVLKKNDMPPETSLRIGIKGGGCSGFSYMLDLCEGPAEGDEVFESQGLRIVCDPKSLLYVDGTEVDFRNELLGGGFVFKNPNSSGSCACGSSFSA